jgi:hypothetical protein
LENVPFVEAFVLAREVLSNEISTVSPARNPDPVTPSLAPGEM